MRQGDLFRLVRLDGFLRRSKSGSGPCRGGVGCAPTTAWSIVSSHPKIIEQELQVQMAAACVAVISLCVDEGFLRGTFDAKGI